MESDPGNDPQHAAITRAVYPESSISYRLISNPRSGGGDDPARFTYIGPDLGDGWIGWSGGENPVPGMRVEVRLRNAEDVGLDVFEAFALPIRSDGQAWFHGGGPFDIIAFRPALSPPAEGEGLYEHMQKVAKANGFDSLTQAIAEALKARQPTPTPAPVDWTVVGPKLMGAVEWYGEQARLARLIHREGDAGRNALAADGGTRARAALAPTQPQSNGE